MLSRAKCYLAMEICCLGKSKVGGIQMKVYAAYGSNINLFQMAKRCPTAYVRATAILTGYRLTFRGTNGGAVANIEPDQAGQVPVMLWELRASDERALDRYENFPTLYRKETVQVRVINKRVKAMVYVMNGEKPLGAPWWKYYNVIRQGYRMAAFDLGILEQAIKASAFPEEEWPDREKLIGLWWRQYHGCDK
ncbi:MAG: Gamma-glutamyl cyclotransferase, AIG2-like [Firmicutes bacterium]|nr:Gamma-glutamyl cyclotransferase, AIG2-like [Bacillota bacterium]